MRDQSTFRCDYIKARRVKYAVRNLGWSQTKTAIIIGLNVGTVSHIINGHRFPDAKPLPF